MYSQRPPHSAPLYPSYQPPFNATTRRRPLPRIPSSSHSAPTSPMNNNNSRPSPTQVRVHDFLDSTTLEMGFDPTCLEGLPDELLYSPVDAFALSCWETLFPGHYAAKSPTVVKSSPRTPAYDPPSYTPYPELYNIPEGSRSAATVRPHSSNESYLEFTTSGGGQQRCDSDLDAADFDADVGSLRSGVCFWDDSDDGGDYDEASSGEEEEEEEEEEDSADDLSAYFAHDAIKNHPILDAGFPDDLLSPDGEEWKSSFVAWESSLLPGHVEVAVDLRDARSNDNSSKPKKTSRIAALRAKIPPIRTSRNRTAALYNTWL